MQPELSELRFFLNDEFSKRRTLRSGYSKRAFSRDLGVGLTSLTEFLNGRRDLSLGNIDRVFKYLKRRKPIGCSWCEKPRQKTDILIGGPKSQYICKTCVGICNEILRSRKPLGA